MADMANLHQTRECWAHLAQVCPDALVIPITYVSIIVGELVPKQLALGHPERIARRVAKPMQMLSVAAAPIVMLLES